MIDVDQEYAEQQPDAGDLHTQAVAAMDRGDYAGAQRLENEHHQEGVPEDGQDDEREPVFDPGEVPEMEPPDPETVEGITELLEQTPGGHDLVEKWGADFEDNIGYARLATQHVAERYSDAVEILNTPLWNPNTEQWVTLGDSPGIIELTAEFGRNIANHTALEPLTVPRRKASTPMNQQTPDAAPGLTQHEQLQELTGKIHSTPSGPDRTRLVREREALAKRLSGDAPIVGRPGRTA